MAYATVADILKSKALHPSQGCACDFQLTPEIHDRLCRLELCTALEAVELVGELAMCEMHEGFDAGDFTRFVAQHNWYNPDLSAGFCKP
jgi:hypothetical protein